MTDYAHRRDLELKLRMLVAGRSYAQVIHGLVEVCHAETEGLNRDHQYDTKQHLDLKTLCGLLTQAEEFAYRMRL